MNKDVCRYSMGWDRRDINNRKLERDESEGRSITLIYKNGFRGVVRT